MQLISKVILATCDFNKHLTMKQLSCVALCSIVKYFPDFRNPENISHITLSTVR